MPPILAFFDMDHTLMDNDCDVSWKEFLIGEGLAEPTERDEAASFYRQYRAGRLDVDAFLAFQLRQMRGRAPDEIGELAQRHFERVVRPRVYPDAEREVARVRASGATTALLTATCEAIAAPVAEAFGFDARLATRLEVADGRYTGRIVPPYCFGEGKIVFAEGLCREYGAALADATYYGDSQSDAPLLERVGKPVAVNPTPELSRLCEARGWPVVRWVPAGA